MTIESAINSQISESIKIFEPNDTKFRPIIGDFRCTTRKLTRLTDILLKSFLKHIKSFTRDSLDFLIKCVRDVDEDTEIVLFEVIGLYTSVPHEFGLEAIDHLFKKKLLESVDSILKNNTLTFDFEFYLQIKETEMGTIFAPT